MATLTVQTVPVDGGLNVTTTAAAAGGDEAPTGNGRLLYVRNTGAASSDVTVTTPGTVKGLAIADMTATVPVGGVFLLPLPGVFAGANGRAAVTYTDNTVLAVAVLEPER